MLESMALESPPPGWRGTLKRSEETGTVPMPSGAVPISSACGWIETSHDGAARSHEGLPARPRRRARAARRKSQDPGGRVRLHHGSERLGQVDPLALAGRSRHTDQRPGLLSGTRSAELVGPGALVAAPGLHRLHLPVFQPVADA